MSLPSAEEINPHDDLDGRVACQHFLGKSLAEAEALFQSNPEFYQDDLMWMGPVAFRYYVQAAIHFLQDGNSAGQAEMICGFAGTLEYQLENHATELAPIAPELAGVCTYLLDHAERLGLVPKSEEETRALVDFLRLQFAAYRQELGETFVTHRPEDFVDLRPRFTALRRAFSDLAQKANT